MEPVKLEAVKLPIVSTLVLFALTGLLAFYLPFPNPEGESYVISNIFQ